MGIQDNSIQSEISPKVFKKAQNLIIQKLENHHYLVTGGNEPHIVDGIFGVELKCDCIASSFGRKCSHILAVEIFCTKENENVE